MSVHASRTLTVAVVTAAAFTDLVAYSVAVPILPDLSRRLGASPTTIGFLFGAFGVTLLAVSIPMGAVSDRTGRKTPLLAGLVALALSTLLFAYAETLPWLFAARLVQGAADAVTWVVGFALIADLYGPAERGRVMGVVMSATSFGLMIGPSIGGWLYEAGGARVPFLAVAALAALIAVTLAFLRLPPVKPAGEPVPLGLIVSMPAVASCTAAVVVGASTAAMLEPVVSLWLGSSLALNPARIGLVFGIGAVASTVLHPMYGRLSDRWGGRTLTAAGLLATASVLPFLSRAASFESAAAIYLVQAAAISLVVTPSLAYMADATSDVGAGFGVAYGIYNVAWGVGLLVGPVLGGVMYERLGFAQLTFVWAPAAAIVAVLLFLPVSAHTASRPV